MGALQKPWGHSFYICNFLYASAFLINKLPTICFNILWINFTECSPSGFLCGKLYAGLKKKKVWQRLKWRKWQMKALPEQLFCRHQKPPSSANLPVETSDQRVWWLHCGYLKLLCSISVHWRESTKGCPEDLEGLWWPLLRCSWYFLSSNRHSSSLLSSSLP